MKIDILYLNKSSYENGNIIGVQYHPEKLNNMNFFIEFVKLINK